MKKPVALLAALTASLSLAGCSTSEADSGNRPETSSSSATEVTGPVTPVTITIGDTAIDATLNDTQAAQDLIGRLPITYSAVRNGDIEYFGALEEPLTEQPANDYPEVGARDIVYYAPKDEVAIIIDETSSPGELTKIGDITGDLSEFEGLPDVADIRIEAR